MAQTEMKRELEEITLFELRDLPYATDHYFDGYQNDEGIKSCSLRSSKSCQQSCPLAVFGHSHMSESVISSLFISVCAISRNSKISIIPFPSSSHSSNNSLNLCVNSSISSISNAFVSSSSFVFCVVRC